jgi:hypothetical protein
MMSSALELPEIVAQILENLSDDKGTLRSASLVHPVWAAATRPLMWSAPSLQALARVPADFCQRFAVWARRIEITQPISAATAAALRDIVFRNLETLVVQCAHGSVPIVWRCPSLKYLHIFQPARDPAVNAVLGMLHANFASLEVVHLCCSVSTAELVTLANMPRLEYLGFAGRAPTSAQVAAVAQVVPKPFAKLYDVVLAAPARVMFILLKLISGITRHKMQLEITFLELHSVDLSPLADVLSAAEGGGSIVKLHLAFPVTHCLRKEHLMPLARLPPTLVDVSLDACDAHENMVHLHIDDDDFVRLFGGQPQLRRLCYFACSPELTIAALAGVGQRCRQLRDLAVGGKFALGQLAPNGPPLFPQLRFLALSGSQPAERCLCGGATTENGDAGAALVAGGDEGNRGSGQGGGHEMVRLGDTVGGWTSVDEMVAKDVILKVSHHAPDLSHLAMTDGGLVDTVINKVWVQQRPGRTSFELTESD